MNRKRALGSLSCSDLPQPFLWGHIHVLCTSLSQPIPASFQSKISTSPVPCRRRGSRIRAISITTCQWVADQGVMLTILRRLQSLAKFQDVSFHLIQYDVVSDSSAFGDGGAAVRGHHLPQAVMGPFEPAHPPPRPGLAITKTREVNVPGHCMRRTRRPSGGARAPTPCFNARVDIRPYQDWPGPG